VSQDHPEHLPSSDPTLQPEEHLAGLGARFLAGVRHVQQGRIDDAQEIFRAILAVEPRLAEPRLELSRIFLDSGRLPEAEAEAREALRLLEAGGQWLDELPEPAVLGIGHGLLAEILRQRADTDEVIFGPPERFHELTRQAREHFAKAATLDPENQHASYHAFFMKLELAGGPEDPEPAG
jgi:tetratricopeptide (TPR) repeat protein